MCYTLTYKPVGKHEARLCVDVSKTIMLGKGIANVLSCTVFMTFKMRCSRLEPNNLYLVVGGVIPNHIKQYFGLSQKRVPKRNRQF